MSVFLGRGRELFHLQERYRGEGRVITDVLSAIAAARSNSAVKGRCRQRLRRCKVRFSIFWRDLGTVLERNADRHVHIFTAREQR